MSVAVQNRVWSSQAITDQGDLCILLALADWSNDEGECWPSLTQLAKKSRAHRATVHRRLAAMRGHWVKWEENNGGRSQRNQYRIVLENLSVPLPDPAPETPDLPPVLTAPEPPKQSHGATVCETPKQSHCATVSTPETVAKSGAKQSHSATGNKPSIEPPGRSLANPHRGGGPEERASAPSSSASNEPAPAFDLSFLSDRDVQYLPDIEAALASYRAEDALDMLVQSWRRKTRPPTHSVAALLQEFGWPVFAAAAVISSDTDRPSLQFLTSILKRLNQQYHEQQTRNNDLDAAELAGGDGAGEPGAFQAIAPRTGGAVPAGVRPGSGRGDALPTRDQVARKREGELTFREYLLRSGYDRTLVASLTDEQVARFLGTGSFGEPGGDGSGPGAAGLPVRTLPR